MNSPLKPRKWIFVESAPQLVEMCRSMQCTPLNLGTLHVHTNTVTRSFFARKGLQHFAWEKPDSLQPTCMHVPGQDEVARPRMIMPLTAWGTLYGHSCFPEGPTAALGGAPPLSKSPGLRG